jgi:hypothetical protein
VDPLRKVKKGPKKKQREMKEERKKKEGRHNW